MQLSKVNSVIQNFKSLFLDNWVLTVGVSGKDSNCVAHCAMEGFYVGDHV
jgi:DNA sulfur modification protein DndC